MIWGYYVSPMMYGQNAIAMNEFLDKRWGGVSYLKSQLIFSYNKNLLLKLTKQFISLEQRPIFNSTQPTVGKALLQQRGLFTDEYVFWICVGALYAFSILFNLMFIAALTFLNRKCNKFHSLSIFMIMDSSVDDLFSVQLIQLLVTTKLFLWRMILKRRGGHN